MKPELHFGDAKIELNGDSVRVWAHNPYKLIKKDWEVIEWFSGPLSWVRVPVNDTFKLDIPSESMLHEFRGMQYLGPVERDDGIEEKIKELLVKFQGAIVITHGCSSVDVINENKVIISGCGSLVDIMGTHNLHNIGPSLDCGANYWRIRGTSVSLESIRTAKANKEEFLKNYERMMKL